jgi:hypothetical protein
MPVQVWLQEPSSTTPSYERLILLSPSTPATLPVPVHQALDLPDPGKQESLSVLAKFLVCQARVGADEIKFKAPRAGCLRGLRDGQRSAQLRHGRRAALHTFDPADVMANLAPNA